MSASSVAVLALPWLTSEVLACPRKGLVSCSMTGKLRPPSPRWATSGGNVVASVEDQPHIGETRRHLAIHESFAELDTSLSWKLKYHS